MGRAQPALTSSTVYLHCTVWADQPGNKPSRTEHLPTSSRLWAFKKPQTNKHHTNPKPVWTGEPALGGEDGLMGRETLPSVHPPPGWQGKGIPPHPERVSSCWRVLHTLRFPWTQLLLTSSQRPFSPPGGVARSGGDSGTVLREIRHLEQTLFLKSDAKLQGMVLLPPTAPTESKTPPSTDSGLKETAPTGLHATCLTRGPR